MFSQKMQIPDKYFLIAVFTTGNENQQHKSYRIVEDDRDLSKYANMKKVELLLYPPVIYLKIHCPDKRVNTQSFPAKTTAVSIVESVCTNLFHLSGLYAYAIYADPSKPGDPIPQNKSIVEVNPELTDVYLLRRFWIRAINDFTIESDIHFNYSQAKDIVFNMNFPHQSYDSPLLTAYALLIEYQTAEKVKNLLKKAKKKELKQILPKYIRKDKKLLNKTKELLTEKEGPSILELKMAFLRVALQNKFFGSIQFPILAQIPGKAESGQYDFTMTEDCLVCLKKGTYDEEFQIRVNQIRKWKPLGPEILKYFYFENIHDPNAGLVEWQIRSKAVIQILDHFTALVNFLKQMKLQSAENQDTHKLESKKSTMRTISSLAGLMTENSTLTMPSEPSEFVAPTPVQSNSYVLSTIDPPHPQQPVAFAAESCTIKTEMQSTVDEFAAYYNPSDSNQYEVEKVVEYTTDDTIIEYGCSLLKDIITQKSLSPIQDAEAFVLEHQPVNPIIAIAVKQYLQTPCETPVDAVTIVSRTLAHLMSNCLPPLDSFVALNYVRSLCLHFARQEWKDFDFVGKAEAADSMLGSVVKSMTAVLHRMNHPLSTAILGNLAPNDPEALSLFNLNQGISESLVLSSIAVAQGLVNAKIGNKILQPILDALPAIPTYDPMISVTLSEALLAILNDLQMDEVSKKKFMAQPHVARLELSSIINSVSELSNLAKFMTSPASMFIQTRSTRLSQVQEQPTTIPEAAQLYQNARESALLLWSMNDAQNAALALDLSENAATMYALFIASMNDPSLQNTYRDSYAHLNGYIQGSNTVLQEHQTFNSLLDQNDPVHSVVLTLLSSNEDVKSTISLLSLDSATEKQKRAVFLDTWNKIDSVLRKIDTKSQEKDIQDVNSNFRLFSFAAVSLAKNDDAAIPLRSRLGEIGNDLIQIMSEEMPDEERRTRAIQIRNELRPLDALAYGENGASERFVHFDKKNVDTPEAYTVTFNVKMPDLSGVKDTLSKLAETLRQFKTKTPQAPPAGTK